MQATKREYAPTIMIASGLVILLFASSSVLHTSDPIAIRPGEVWHDAAGECFAVKLGEKDISILAGTAGTFSIKYPALVKSGDKL